MFSRKRSDTKVGSVEKTYGIELHARSDMLLGNLLRERGFDSQSQLVAACRGRATRHARKRRVFASFHAEDLQQVQGFRLMLKNPGVALDFYDGSVRRAIHSASEADIEAIITEKIRSCSVVACLIGNGTAWREWVDWELETALKLGKGICGIRLKGAVGRAPDLLRERDAPVARWDLNEMVSAIEGAAARRG